MVGAKPVGGLTQWLRKRLDQFELRHALFMVRIVAVVTVVTGRVIGFDLGGIVVDAVARIIGDSVEQYRLGQLVLVFTLGAAINLSIAIYLSSAVDSRTAVNVYLAVLIEVQIDRPFLFSVVGVQDFLGGTVLVRCVLVRVYSCGCGDF